MVKESKNLDERLLELGEDLKSPPSSIDELYSLLDVTDRLLARVDQSPSQLMLDALEPITKALAVKDFLRHSDMDVKVSVASCISEITRITAPEAPYEDDIMKEIFQMIVGAFEGLDDMSNRSYQKRVSILETVAKVRSCVVMLDLECDALILQMFQHFLKTIRVDHSENVFSSMETIMTLVIEESEDISTELLSCLLDTVKKDNKDVLPIAAKLAEKVMTCCASKIKQYLLGFIQSTGASMREYGKVVASICQENSDDLDHSEMLAFGEAVADDSKLSERTVSDELPQVSAKVEQEVGCPEKVATVADSSPISATSTDNIQMGNGDSMDQPSSPKHKCERSLRTGQSNSIAPDQTVSVNIESIDLKPDGAVDLRKRKGRKTKSSVQLTDTAERIDNDNDALVVTRRKRRTKEADGSDDNAHLKVEDLVVPLPPKKNEVQELPGSDNPTCDISPAPIDTLPNPPNPSRTKRGRPPGPRAAAKRSDVDAVADPPASVSARKDSSDDNQVHEEVVHSKGGDYDKEPDDVEAPTDLASDSDVKAKKTTSKKGRYKRGKAAEEDTLGRRQKSNMKQQKEEGIHGKDVDGEPTLREMASSPRSASKAPNADEAHLGDSAKPKSRRKRASGTKVELDESLVGSRIKVWWPKDKMFYEGVVESYDFHTKKHKIVYTDGDVEHLVLNKERWEYAENDLEKDKGKEEGSASQMSQTKKMKADSPSKTDLNTSKQNTSKHVKSHEQSKSGAESSGKDVPRSRGRPRSGTSNLGKLSYDDSPGTIKKSKDKPASDDKVQTHRSSEMPTDVHVNKPDEEAPKRSSKQEEPHNKYSRKSKNEPSKSSRKSKNDTPTTGTRLKDDTSKVVSTFGDDFDNVKDSTPKAASGSDPDEVGKNNTPRTKPTTNSSSKTGGDSKPNGIPSKRKAEAGYNEGTTIATDDEAKTDGTGGMKRRRRGRK